MTNVREIRKNNSQLAELIERRDDLSQLDDSYNKLIHTLKEFEDGQ